MARSVVNIADLHARARRRLPRMLYDFIAGGAEDERTLAENRRAFDLAHLQPRVLVDVATRNTGVTVLGQELSLPVLLAPVGLAGIAGPGGERAAARAADRAGTVSVVSTAASSTLESVAAVADRPQWFQLYPWGDRQAVEAMIRRARDAGYSVMVITVDVPITGARERDDHNGFTVPPRPTLRNFVDLLAHPRWLAALAAGPPINFANLGAQPGEEGKGVLTLAQRHAGLTNPGHTWADLKWMRDLWQGPVLLKGVTCAGDAHRAAEAGCNGVIVSNHGGRQLDALPGTLRLLPEVVAAVGDQMEVLLDGGIERGTDVVKALALGARAVLVGKSWLYGLAARGESGIEQVLDILGTELDRTLCLMGRTGVDQLGPSDLLLDPTFRLQRPGEPG